MPILKSTPNSTTPLVDENGLPTRQFQLLMAALTEPGNITSYDLADGAVLTTKLANGSVSTDKLPDNVITATKISDNSITTSKILANAITSNLIAAGAIVTDKIYANSIITQHLTFGAVTNPTIGDYAVSNTAYSQGNGNSGIATISLRTGARVSIFATYAGGDNQGFTGFDGTMTATVNGAGFTNNTATIRQAVSQLGYTTFVISGVTVVTSISASHYSSGTSLLAFYTAPTDGIYNVQVSASGGFGQLVSVLVMELAK